MTIDPPDRAGLAADAPPLHGDAPAPPWWRRALPFAIAAGLVAFTLRRVDLSAFAQQIAAVNAPAFLGLASLFVVALLTADAFATTVVYRRTVAPIRFA